MTGARFLLLADPQLGCYASFSGMTPEQSADYARRGMRVPPSPPVEGFEWDADRLRLAVDLARGLRPDFVVIAGDMVDDARDEAQYAEFMRAIERLDGIPVRWLPGNHDAAFDGRRPTRESLAHYRARFGDDRYAFDEGGVRFVALNTSVAQHPDALPDEWAAQLDFLRDALESRPPGMAAILLGHHPLFVSEPDEPDSYWTIPAAPRRAILDLVHRHDVLAAFAGHLHRNALARDRGFEMVTTGPVGFPLGEDPSGVRIVEVRDGQLTHRYEALPVDGPPEPANRA